ncbi:hypothetical protein E2C01_030210 [Portunus trituberculatus]|uniref:Uncharacterized protein n=1 Tax=Portunus trituberculatus TaxID=210409 RepID=A0A5B7ERG7_PORTR|nr:hypothetical protein [Portunus trituberculatus]
MARGQPPCPANPPTQDASVLFFGELGKVVADFHAIRRLDKYIPLRTSVVWCLNAEARPLCGFIQGDRERQGGSAGIGGVVAEVLVQAASVPPRFHSTV